MHRRNFVREEQKNDKLFTRFFLALKAHFFVHSGVRKCKDEEGETRHIFFDHFLICFKIVAIIHKAQLFCFK